MLAVIHADRANGDQRSIGMGRCGIQPPSKTCFQDEPIEGAGFKVDQGRSDQLLERGQVVMPCYGLELF